MKSTVLFFLLIPFLIFSQGNPAIAESNIDDVWNQFNLTGEGVIFASMERGLDYRHPAYLNPDGTTRVAYIYDMVNQAGANAPNNPYGRGTIFTEADINAALIAGGTPISIDRHGHGNACIGITAGNGGGTTNLEFKGVATKAKLIVVKMIQDGFQAYGTQPSEAGYFNASDIPIALQFIHDKVTELGLPSVTLMNFGSIGGPTDGTSTVSRAMDDFIAQGHVLVCGIGDDGGQDNHASTAIAQGQTIELLINKFSSNVRLDLYYSEDDRFDVTIEVPNGTQYGPYTAPAGANMVNDKFISGIFNKYHRGANQEFYGATSNTRELLVDFFGPNGVYKVILTGTSINDDGVFNASLNPSLYYNNNSFGSFVVSGSSLNDYTSSFNVISPGDYVVDNTWTDINGVPRSITGAGNPGELWAGSSSGITYDGRQAIDFVVPGEVLIGPYYPDSFYEFFAANQVLGGNGFYGIQNAVSAAAPVSCGVIALMLELDPTLTNQEIKDILNQTSRQDSFTGTVPNADWGYGKLDALAAVQEVSNLLSVSDNENSFIKIYPNPVTDILNIDSQTGMVSIRVVSVLGQEVLHFDNVQDQVDLSSLTKGIYVLQFKSESGSKNLKIIKQ